MIIVEPDYNDSPVHLSGHGNDNHPPLPVSFGEIFIKGSLRGSHLESRALGEDAAGAALR